MTHADLLALLLPPGAYDHQAPRLAAELAAEGRQLDQALYSADLVADAIFPYGAGNLFSDWERNYGLPDRCMAGLSLSSSQRLSALLGKIRQTGGLSRPYFINLAAALGYPITITEFDDYTCESECEYNLFERVDAGWGWAWQINAPGTTVWEADCEAPCEDPLRSWGNELLECVISDLAPAETAVHFSYG